jgi:rhodanese-related sulfurtransferase
VLSFLFGSTPEVTVDELDDLMRAGGIRLVDVREGSEFKRGRVPGAVNVPLRQLPNRTDGLPRNKRILVICESGSRSRSATNFLIKAGFEGAASVRGGTHAWARTNRPLVRG